jgi:hypothetical protein
VGEAPRASQRTPFCLEENAPPQIHRLKPESSVPTTYLNMGSKERQYELECLQHTCTCTKASEGGLDRIDAQRRQALSSCLRICTSDLCYLMEPRTHQETHGRGIISGILDGVAQAAINAPLRKVTQPWGTPQLLRRMHVSHRPLGALGITIRLGRRHHYDVSYGSLET